MDNDLMARRLRPPSQPTQSSNGQSSNGQGSFDTDGWDAEHAQAAPLDAPWDRPASEPWPPTDPSSPAAPMSPAAPTTPANIAPEWPPAQAPIDAPQGDHGQSSNGMADWEPGPSSDWPAAPEPQIPPMPEAPAVYQPAADAPWDRPADVSQTADLRAEQRPSWDRPSPDSSDQHAFDDCPPAMIEEFEAQEQRWPEPAAPASPAPASPEFMRPPIEVHSSDPYDAFAPVMSDVSHPVIPAPPAWAARDARPAHHEPVPPQQSARPEIGPTPPADLFENHAHGDPLPADPVAGPPDVPPPTAPTSVVVRIELALVDDGSGRLTLAERARRVGPTSEETSFPADQDDASVALTPRHPEFEPRSHTLPDPILPEPDPIPAETGPRVDLPWGLPPLAAAAQDARPPWTDAQPTWNAQQAPPNFTAPAPINAFDPLAGLPAANFAPAPAFQPAPVAQPPAVAHAAPVAQGQVAQAQVARAQAAPLAQGDLWFLASEPEPASEVDTFAEAASGEPSSLLTAGLTIGFAILVIVLVLVFIQLMTSLLR